MVRAIESEDKSGRLVSRVEIEQLERRLFEEVRLATAQNKELDILLALDRRAELTLDIVAKRNASIAGMQHITPWRDWFVGGVPLAAFLLGIATDRIANPHRVDLLSLPFLVILLWNITLYVVLVSSSILRKQHRTEAPFAPLVSWLARVAQRGGRIRGLHYQVVCVFQEALTRVTAQLHDQRMRGILHFSALAWGAGVAASLILRGVVVEYRAGWESTFLSAEQVHSVLSILFMPVTTLLSLDPFTLQEISNMRFGTGAGLDASHGRRWVLLYAGLLGLVVVLPRLCLGLWAWWRARVLSIRVKLDTSEPYFQDLLDKLSPAHVRLRVDTVNPEIVAMLVRVFRDELTAAEKDLVVSANGDSLRIETALPRKEQPVSRPIWPLLTRLKSNLQDDLPLPIDKSDAVLVVVGNRSDSEHALSVCRQEKSVLILVNMAAGPEKEAVMQDLYALQIDQELNVGILALDSFALCWVQDHALFDAIAKLLPRSKAKGFVRIVRALDARNKARFEGSMNELSARLSKAARDREKVGSEARSLASFVTSAQRDSYDLASVIAAKSLALRVEEDTRETFKRLLKIYQIGDFPIAHPVLESFESKVEINSAMSTSQAAAGGAAAGAAVGAGIDVMAGGMTLGAATLLGAIIGGGSAGAGALLKNRSSESGVTEVRIPEDALIALVENGVLGYLKVVHMERKIMPRSVDAVDDSLKRHVTLAVNAQRDELRATIATIRAAKDSEAPTKLLAVQLEAIALGVMRTLYPSK